MKTRRKHPIEDYFAMHPAFTLKEFAENQDKRGNLAAAWNQLKYHVGKGKVKKIARGLYATVPPGANTASFQPDRYWVGAAARPDGIFCYHAALELLGESHSVWNECTLFCSDRRTPIDLNGVTIRFLTFPTCITTKKITDIGLSEVDRRGRMLRVTGPERTLVESFRQPNRVGGLEELIACASGFGVLDLDLLEEILKQYAQRVLWATVGWFLERFQDRFFVSDTLLKRFEKQIPKKSRYLLRNQRGGRTCPRWNLIVPEALLSEKGKRHGEP